MLNFKIIAVDFDGTLCENKWPEIGEPNLELIKHLKKEKAAGAKIILWTCRVDEALSAAVLWCDKNHQLQFDMINGNLPEVIKEFGSDTRKIFAHEYIDDKMCRRFGLPYVNKEKSWAELEVEIACNHENPNRKDGEFDYGCACYESALKAYKSLSDDGHSGFSIGMTKHILDRLIEGKPLTPIEDTGDVWSDISDISGLNGEEVNYQCRRMSSLFKYVYSDGTVNYKDVNRCYGVDVNNSDNTFSNGLITSIIDEMFPITMPYCPGKAIAVYCEDFLIDKKNGDFDTRGVFYALKSDGEKVSINRFFKEAINSWDEIDKSEYADRKRRKIK